VATRGDEIAALLGAASRLDDVAEDRLLALLGEVEQVRAALWRRLLAARRNEEAGRRDQPVQTAAPPDLLDVDAAAALVHRSVSWVRRNGRSLPGYRQSKPGFRVRWSRRELEKWLSQNC
jgi:hypothetical protein